MQPYGLLRPRQKVAACSGQHSCYAHAPFKQKAGCALCFRYVHKVRINMQVIDFIGFHEIALFIGKLCKPLILLALAAC